MTVVHALLLKFAGMDWIDSLSHAFSTLGTGGFSTKNASIGHYNSAAIDWICTLFMFFSGVNFTLYYYMFTREISEIKTNTEFKAYIGISLISVLLVTFLQAGYFGGFFKSLRYSAFTVASILTTTGYGVSDYTFWLPASQCILFALFFIGGSSGSTSGGVKVIRWVILSKQLKNELLKILHPHGIFSIRLNQRAGRKDVVYSVAAYFFLYAIFVLITTFVGAIARMDIFTAFTGAISMVGNVGPGFNALGPSNNCAWLCDGVKWWYCLAMIAGRLELFTLFIFFIPDYWRK
jgi:trk system potassium uptake protein TrkH